MYAPGRKMIWGIPEGGQSLSLLKKKVTLVPVYP
jgi:hypothetical protein